MSSPDIQSTPESVLHLNEFQESLNTASENVYFKVEGSGKNERVVVVQGRFWNWIASIAVFFGVSSYKIDNICRVFKKELQQAKGYYEGIAPVQAERRSIIKNSCTVAAFLFCELLLGERADKTLSNTLQLFDVKPQEAAIQDIWGKKEKYPELHLDRAFLKHVVKIDEREKTPIVHITLEGGLQLIPVKKETPLTVKEALRVHHEKFSDILGEDIDQLDEEQVISKIVQYVRQSVEKLNAHMRQNFSEDDKDGLAYGALQKISGHLNSALNILRDEKVKSGEALDLIGKFIEEGNFVLKAFSENADQGGEIADTKVAMLQLRSLLRKAEIFIKEKSDRLDPFEKVQIERQLEEFWQRLDPRGAYANKERAFSDEFLRDLTIFDVRSAQRDLFRILEPLKDRWNENFTFVAPSKKTVSVRSLEELELELEVHIAKLEVHSAQAQLHQIKPPQGSLDNLIKEDLMKKLNAFHEELSFAEVPSHLRNTLKQANAYILTHTEKEASQAAKELIFKLKLKKFALVAKKYITSKTVKENPKITKAISFLNAFQKRKISDISLDDFLEIKNALRPLFSGSIIRWAETAKVGESTISSFNVLIRELHLDYKEFREHLS